MHTYLVNNYNIALLHNVVPVSYVKLLGFQRSEDETGEKEGKGDEESEKRGERDGEREGE